MIGIIIVCSMILLFVIAITVFGFNKASYKHECDCFIPVGENPEDVIKERDKFKVVRKEGHYQIWFYKHRGKSYNPPNNAWMKVWKGKKSFPKDEGERLNCTENELRKHIVRGAMFYNVGPREWKVMSITKKGDVQVLDQDTMEMFLDDMEREKQLTTTWRDKLLQVSLWLGSIFLIALFGVIVLTLTFKFAGEQSTNILAHAAQQAAQGVVGG